MIVVVGLAFEARIAAGPGVRVICSGDGQNLHAALKLGVQTGCAGLISFGVAGGLVPRLKPGTCVIASEIICDGVGLPTDRFWVRKLLDTVPGTVRGAIVGAAQPVMTPAAKRALHIETGAVAVDTESHVVARAAAEHGLPMVALRVIADPAGRALPDIAVGAVRADGTTDVLAVLRRLARRPRDLLPLMRTALDAQAATATLRRGRRLLGPNLSLLTAPQPPAPAMAEPTLGPLETPALGSSFG